MKGELLKEPQHFCGPCCLRRLRRTAMQKQRVAIRLQEWLNPCEQGLLLVLGLWTSLLPMPTQEPWDSNQILGRINQCQTSFQFGMLYPHPEYSSRMSWFVWFWTEKPWKNMDHIVVKHVSFMTHPVSNCLCDQYFWTLSKLLRYSACTLSSL